MSKDDEKKRVTSIFEFMVDGVYMIDRDFNVEYMNDTMAKDFGPGVGKKCHQIIHGKEALCDWCRAEKVFEGKTIRTEQYIQSVDRTYDIVEFPLKHSDGTLSKVSIFRDISQIKEHNEMIRISEDKYQRLSDNIRSGIYVSTKEGRFLDANRALLEMLGYESKEEFFKINIEKDLYLRPEDRRKFQMMIERDGYVTNYEIDFKNKKGERIPVTLTSHVRYDQKGQIIGYEGIIVDQTQRKQIEEDYRRLFEHVGCGVFISSKRGRFLNANQALLDMLGYESKEDFLKIDIAEDLYLRSEDRLDFQKMIEAEGQVVDYEVMFKRRDGTPIPILLTAHARHDQQGKIIGYEGINVDLSHRKEMERQVKEAHDLLDRIIRSSPNAIMATDLEGNILIWNRGAEEILGYKADEVLRKMNIRKIYPEGMAKEVMKMMRSDAYGGKGRLGSYPMVHIRRDGEIVEGNLSAAILYDSQGNEIGSVGIFTDLRERLEMERKLMETQEKLLQSEKLAAMGRLTSQIAHELNNPLYGIMNTLELVKTEISPQSKRRKILDMALSETVRLTELLRKMLSFSKPDEEERQRTDINAILDEILLLVKKQLLEHSIRIVTDFAPDLGMVFASRNQLRQVFLNMIANARDAMADGGILTVKTKREGDHVYIELKDTGIGIRKENIDKIFDAFFTTKDSVKDVGLGLSVCYSFIRDHGGDIKVMSSWGEGTTFRISLPSLTEERPSEANH